ncbi:MAG: hypothetical protein KGH65_01590 [Candidatus Micrarchaeota archaeon]|nr:hypothetical protein [Candidatus Micrarchaeota archaeon]
MEIIKSDKGRYRLFFFIASFVFISFATALAVFGLISFYVQLATLADAILFVAYSTLFLISEGKRKVSEPGKLALNGTFAFLVINFLILLLVETGARTTMTAYLVSAYQYVAINFVLFLPLIFLTFFGLYLYRQGYRKLSAMLFGMFVVVMILYFFSGLVYHHYKIDDEIFIQFASTKYLLAGMNPYGMSVSSQIFYNSTSGAINSPSITTTNHIIGTLNYPSLFLLSFMPFYLISTPTLQNLVNIDIEAQGMIFLLLAFFATALLVEKRYIEKPVYGIILFLTIAMAYLSSITIFLMFALLLVAYAKLESRYSWLFLGLCLSIQEQLWFPVILLIIYSASNSGIRKGAQNLIGSLGVFIALNLYFILLNPSAFFGNLFGPVNQLLLPESSSPIGYLIATNYHMLLGTFSIVFLAAMALFAMLFAYLNQKRLVGIFAMVPFLFLSHSIPIYYTFFTGFAIVSLFIAQKGGKGQIRRWMGENRNAVLCIVAVVVAVPIYLICGSHLAYQNNFNLSVSNASIHFDSALNKTVYTATIHYANLSNDSVYVFAGVISKYNIGFAGILNYALINDSVQCGGEDYRCMVNVNKIALPGNASSYSLVMYIRPSSGNPVYGVRANIYNGEHLYVSDGVFNQSILGMSSGK